jgi:alkylhydroperoxidase family enzyme
MGRLLTRFAGRALGQVRHVTPVPPQRAQGVVARVYQQMTRDFGMIAPPVALHSPVPAALAACWLMLRESLLATGSAPRSVKEVVAAAISAANACPYCVDVHTAVLSGLLPRAAAAGGAAGRLDTLRDPRLRAVAAWARSGGAGPAGEPPIPAEQVAELVGVAVTFHYLNRMVSTFLAESPIPPRIPAALHTGVRRTMGRVMAPTARATREPGAALDLLPAADLPADFAWAAGRPSIAAAFARAIAAVDALPVPAPVRGAIHLQLSTWDDHAAGPDPGWLDAAVGQLEPDHRDAGRLALLTAFAPYRVSARVIDGYRQTGADDAALIAVTAWASLAAARRLGARLADPASQDLTA